MCVNVCKSWNDVLGKVGDDEDDNGFHMSFLWTPSYVQVALAIETNIENVSTVLFNKVPRFDWRKKVREVASFIDSKTPIVIEEALKRSNTDDDNNVNLRLVSRSGHSASRLIHLTSSLADSQEEEIVVIFGGASHFFRFLNSFDIIRVNDGKIIKSGLHADGDIPSPRWLHSSVVVPNNISISCHMLNDCRETDNILIFGGQSDHQVEDDIFLFNICYDSENQVTSVDSVLLIAEGVKPCARAGHSLLLTSSNTSTHKYILFGGLSNTKCLNDVYMLNVVSKSEAIEYHDCPYKLTWEKLCCTGQTPSERWCHSAVLREHDYIVFGGWNYIRHQVQNQIF